MWHYIFLEDKKAWGLEEGKEREEELWNHRMVCVGGDLETLNIGNSVNT